MFGERKLENKVIKCCVMYYRIISLEFLEDFFLKFKIFNENFSVNINN